MNISGTASSYSERLLPGPGLFIALLLVVPGVTLVLSPIIPEWSLAYGIGMYVALAVTLVLLSPSISVIQGELYAGRARIPVSALGEITVLGADSLRMAIGTELDARSYLVVRGWIHSGLKIEIVDANDPTPFWILTTRKPVQLLQALETSRTLRESRGA